MKFLKLSICLFMTLNLISCSEKEEKISLIKENNLEMQMIEAYNEGLKEFNKGDVFFAAKKFNEVELLYPQSIWAPRSILMAAYSYYSQMYFTDAIIEIERFLDKYKNHPNTDYAYYLLAICHYNLIVDEKKDLGEIIKAKEYFILLVEEFPNTAWASLRSALHLVGGCAPPKLPRFVEKSLVATIFCHRGNRNAKLKILKISTVMKIRIRMITDM